MEAVLAFGLATDAPAAMQASATTIRKNKSVAGCMCSLTPAASGSTVERYLLQDVTQKGHTAAKQVARRLHDINMFCYIHNMKPFMQQLATKVFATSDLT